jgi:hypothetical protein
MEEVLSSLVGHPCWGYWRTRGILAIQFGDRVWDVVKYGPRKGQRREVGAYAFHIYKQWRLRGRDGIVTGTGDHIWPAGVSPDDDSGWGWDMEGRARADELLDAHFAKVADRPPTVQSVQVDEAAGVAIHLSDGHTLEVFPNDSRDSEEWRLLQPARDVGHFLVQGGRVAEDVDWA